jgi:hypothetical protein
MLRVIMPRGILLDGILLGVILQGVILRGVILPLESHYASRGDAECYYSLIAWRHKCFIKSLTLQL